MPSNPAKKQKILITGGTGFIGSHLARQLVEERHSVVLMDLRPNPHRISDLTEKVEVIQGNVAHWNSLLEILQTHQIQHIFHTAAALSVEAEYNLSAAYRSNIEGTYNILEAARILNLQQVVFLSSLAVFGANTPFPFGETSYRDPGSFYGVSKAFGEMLGQYYHVRHNLDFRCARFAVAIGPGRRGAGATVTYSTFLERIALGNTGIIDIPESTILPVIYVEDIANFLIALWKAENLKQRLFIAGGVPISIQELITEGRKYAPKAKVQFKIDPQAERVAQTWSFLTMMLIQKGQETIYREIKELNWKLQYTSVEEIVKQFINQVRSRKEVYSAF
jgi:nucleoside-diphosphate-sugar epimerase